MSETPQAPTPLARRAAAIGAAVLTVLALALTARQAWAVETRRGEKVDVRQEEVIDDDVFATGQVVTIAGTVRGDVIAFGRSVVIRGRVEGDVIAFAQTIEVLGDVGGSARLAAQTITVSSHIGRNLLTVSQHAAVLAPARVGGNWLAGGQQVTLSGTLGRGLLASAEQVRLAGTVARDVRAGVSRLVVEPGAVVGGTLTYRSPQEGLIDPTARIGAVRFLPEERPAAEQPGAWRVTVFQALRFLGFVLFGLLLVSLFPGVVQRFTHHLERGPLTSLLLGFATLAATPVALALVALTVLGLPVALFLASAYLGAIYAGQMFLYPALTGWLWKHLRRSPPGARWGLVIGSLAFFLLGLVPYLGPAVRLVSASWALGLTVLALRDAAGVRLT